MKTRTIIQSDLSKSRTSADLSVLCPILSVFGKVWSKHFDAKVSGQHQTLEITIPSILRGAHLVTAREVSTIFPQIKITIKGLYEPILRVKLGIAVLVSEKPGPGEPMMELL
jgi:hypothetical protein